MNKTVLLFFILGSLLRHGHMIEAYVFGMVTKALDNPFFNLSHMACADKAAELQGECMLVGPEQGFNDVSGEEQAAIIDDLVRRRAVDALAVAVMDAGTVGPAIDRAVRAGIPVVTFDSDAPASKRTAYIGTDNYFFGTQIARVLKQLKPTGGTYACIADTAPNLQERLRGFQDEIQRDTEVWVQADNSPAMALTNLTLIMEQMNDFARDGVKHIVPLMGAAMRSGGWIDFVNAYRDQDLTLVSGDAMMNQLELLDRGYAHGLVGQLPYEMGALSIKTLQDILEGNPPTLDVIGTNVLNHILIPLVLPPLEMDHNLVGSIHVVGYILFGTIAAATLMFAGWTYTHSQLVVVKAAQPMFLYLILLGVLCMASSIVPLSFEQVPLEDDDGDDDDKHGAWMCMPIPWLGFCGFSLTFAALFSKTMRVNKLFKAGEAVRRTKVSEREVMVPLVLLLTANIGLLLWWTLTDPLVYTRQDLPGTDGWNRVLSTYGSCRSEHVALYLTPLTVVNVGVLILANLQAYEARHIMAEFAEARYIGLTMLSLLQATGMAVPILFVVRESPVAFYLLLVFVIFAVTGAVLVLIFIPKLALVDKFKKHSPAQQSQMIRRSVLETQTNLKLSRSSISRGSTGSITEPTLQKPNIAPPSMRWSQLDLSTLEEAESGHSNSTVKFNPQNIGNHDDSDGSHGSSHLPTLRSGVCESILEEDSGDFEASGLIGMDDNNTEAPEQAPTQDSAHQKTEEFDELAEQVGKRMAIHARGAPRSESL